MNVALVLDPIAGVWKAFVAVATRIRFILGVTPYVFAQIFQWAARLAAEIAGVLPRERVSVPTLGPNLADRRYDIQLL